MSNFSQTGKPINKTATGAVANSMGNVLGVFCSSSTSGTLALHDNASAASGDVVVAQFSLTPGTFYPIPASFARGLYATIGGAADITFFIA